MPQSDQSYKADATSQFFSADDIKRGRYLDFGKVKTRSKRSYSWTTEENYLYMSYLKMFKNQLEVPEMGKYLKFFTRMARIITTRSSHQIKSHHQKMLMKYKHIEAIIKNVEITLGFELYQSEDLFQKIKSLDSSINQFLITEKETVSELFCFYRARMESEGTLTREIEQKLLKMLPNLPRMCEVKIQEDEVCYRIYETPYGMEDGQSAACKNEFY